MERAMANRNNEECTQGGRQQRGGKTATDNTIVHQDEVDYRSDQGDDGRCPDGNYPGGATRLRDRPQHGSPPTEVWAKQQEEDKGAWVALDFAKAFDSMSHQLIEAMLRVIGVEERWIRVIINFTKGPVGFLVGQEIPDRRISPAGGIKQGTPYRRRYTR